MRPTHPYLCGLFGKVCDLGKGYMSVLGLEFLCEEGEVEEVCDIRRCLSGWDEK